MVVTNALSHQPELPLLLEGKCVKLELKASQFKLAVPHYYDCKHY